MNWYREDRIDQKTLKGTIRVSVQATGYILKVRTEGPNVMKAAETTMNINVRAAIKNRAIFSKERVAGTQKEAVRNTTGNLNRKVLNLTNDVQNQRENLKFVKDRIEGSNNNEAQLLAKNQVQYSKTGAGRTAR
jgi:hypothetical protein